MVTKTENDPMFMLKQRVDNHIERYEEHELAVGGKFDKLVDAQRVNTEAISTLTVAVSTLVQDTSSIVQLHKDFQGAARIGGSVQGFMIWCLKWGAVGVGVSTALTWLINHFGK